MLTNNGFVTLSNHNRVFLLRDRHCHRFLSVCARHIHQELPHTYLGMVLRYAIFSPSYSGLDLVIPFLQSAEYFIDRLMSVHSLRLYLAKLLSFTLFKIKFMSMTNYSKIMFILVVQVSVRSEWCPSK